MEELLALLNQYDKEKHIKILKDKIKVENYDRILVPIYDEIWLDEEKQDLPYEVITQILDSYYCLPERIDLAFLFCWQSINNSYNELLIKNSAVNFLNDTKGISLLVDMISDSYTNKYKNYLEDYIDKAPIKIFKFISNYILKGYVIDKSGYSEKYYSSSYKSFQKRFFRLYEDICTSYGEAFKSLCNPQVNITGTKVLLNIKAEDINKSMQIINSLANKLETLVKVKNVKFKSSNLEIEYMHTFVDKDVIEFMIACVLYANRCNNFHGNVASRLNSIYSNEESYLANKYIFLLAHMVCAISLNINGYLSDSCLYKLKQNNELL